MFSLLLAIVALEVLAESFSICHLVTHERNEETLPTFSCPDLSLLCHHGCMTSFLQNILFMICAESIAIANT